MNHSVFLAGGISNCHDWQAEMTTLLQSKCPGIGITNPRNPHYDPAKEGALESQITWEFTYLRLASAILFWFPPETLCPITLFELGTWTQRALLLPKEAHPPEIFIGCDPKYARIDDVRLQTALAYKGRRAPEVVTSLQDLADKVIAWWHTAHPASLEALRAMEGRM
jgi:hypothetical protein